MEVHVPKEIYSIKTEGDRNIITSSSVFGILFSQLKKNIGEIRVKRFLFQYGWEMGTNDGKDALELGLPTDALIKYGPRLHIKNGHIAGIDHECRVVRGRNQEVTSVLGQGVWIDSYEAREYKRIQGVSDSTVCHTLVGYSSGYMSTILKKPLLAKEVTCVGRGDQECRWVIKTIKEWEKEGEKSLLLFKDQPIINELSYTYEQLYEERQYLEKIADFQNELTGKIVEGSNLKEVADKAFQLIQIPVIIEDAITGNITYSGLTKGRYTLLKGDLSQSTQNKTALYKGSKQQLKGELIKTELQKRLVAPVIVEQKQIGYCSFIYGEDETIDPKKDYLLLERFSNAISLILMNEKTKYESFERMKGHFLERMVEGSLSKPEIMRRGQYAGVDITKSYYIAMVGYWQENKSIEEDLQFEEGIYETTTYYFKDRSRNILVGQYEGKTLVYLAFDERESEEATKLMTDYYKHINGKYHQQLFMGVSHIRDDIEEITKSIEEARVAIGGGGHNGLTFFNDLGLLGVLINTQNKQAIKLFAEQDLGPIFADKDSHELLKTLYSYLLHGGNLKKTAVELTLSMGGLRHRINKIENLLHVDLREPRNMHKFFFLLQSLVSLGELKVK